MPDTLARLSATIAARAGADPAASHTAALLARGAGRMRREVRRGGGRGDRRRRRGDRAALTREAADVLYHLQVMLHAGGVAWAEVLAELERREGRSGIAEKAARG